MFIRTLAWVIWLISCRVVYADMQVMLGWSGVLLDSGVRVPARAMEAVYEQEHLMLPTEGKTAFKSWSGYSSFDMVRLGFPSKDPITQEAWTKQLSQALQKYYLQEDLNQDILPVLALCQKRGWSIWTIWPHDNTILEPLTQHLAQQGLKIQGHVSAQHALAGPPSTDLFKQFAQMHQIKMKEVLIIEGTFVGALAAIRSGAWTIFLTETGMMRHVSTQELLKQWPYPELPHFFIPNLKHFEAVLTWIDRYQKQGTEPATAPRGVWEGYVFS